jgi:hypothetical protein
VVYIARDRNRNLLNIAIVVLIVLIILAVYSIIQNSQNNEILLTTEKVLDNAEEYIGRNITIVGYFSTEAGGVITSIIIDEGQSSTLKYERLPVNTSNINTSGLLAANIKYKFKGRLILDELNVGETNAVILIAKKIEPL